MSTLLLSLLAASPAHAGSWCYDGSTSYTGCWYTINGGLNVAFTTDDAYNESLGAAWSQLARCGLTNLGSSAAEAYFYNSYVTSVRSSSSAYATSATTVWDDWAPVSDIAAFGSYFPFQRADQADIALFSSLGSAGGGGVTTCSGPSGSPQTLSFTSAGSSVASWGLSDMEVVALSASYALNTTPSYAVAAALMGRGTHQFLGFATTVPDYSGPGILYAYYLATGNTYVGAWYYGAQGTIGHDAVPAGIVFYQYIWVLPYGGDPYRTTDLTDAYNETLFQRSGSSTYDSHSGGYLTWSWST